MGTARPDFLDRALMVEFLSITPELRQDEAQFWHEFAARRPRILGACSTPPWRDFGISAGQARAATALGRLCPVGKRV